MLAGLLVVSLSLNGLFLFVIYRDSITMAELRRIAISQSRKKNAALEKLDDYMRGD